MKADDIQNALNELLVVNNASSVDPAGLGSVKKNVILLNKIVIAILRDMQEEASDEDQS